MPIEDMASWADNIEMIRLPRIETDVATNLALVNALNTTLSGKVQDYDEEFLWHNARINAGQETADTARDLANLALSRLIGSGTDSQTYTNDRIQQLEDLLSQQINSITGQFEAGSDLSNMFEDRMLAIAGQVRTDFTPILLGLDSTLEFIQSEVDRTNAVTDEMIQEIIPQVTVEIDRVANIADTVKSEVDRIFTGFDYETLLEGVDDVRDQVWRALDPIGKSVLAAPLADWTLAAHTSVYDNPKAALPGANLHTAVHPRGVHGVLSTGSAGQTLGQAVPVDFFPDRFYLARAQVFTDGEGGPVNVALGVTTFVGPVVGTAAAKKPVLTGLTQADGIKTVSCIFSTDGDKLIEYGYRVGSALTDEAVALVGSDGASQAFFFVEQNGGGSTAGRLRIKSLEIVDITSAINVVRLTRERVESQFGDAFASIDQMEYTLATLDAAVALLSTDLESRIEDVESNLSLNYLTSTQANEAIAAAASDLDSRIGDVESNLSVNYFTKAETDTAIAAYLVGGEATAVIDAAEDARDAALSHATAAFSSAGAAASSATAADQSAQAGLADRLLAETARSAAQGARDLAIEARNNASGSASVASTQAGISTNASGEALRLSADMLPSSFERDSMFWCGTTTGTPATRISQNLVAAFTFNTDAQEGRYVQLSSPVTSNQIVAPKTYVPTAAGRRYRVTVRAMHVGAFSGTSGTNALRIALRRVSSSYGFVSDLSTLLCAFTSPDVWQTFVLEAVFSGTEPYILPFAYITNTLGSTAGRSIRISRLSFQDITSESAAAQSASAAATSAQSASSSADLAGQRAAAAEESRLQANTARGGAESAQAAAAISENNAAGSSSTATQQATLATSARSDMITFANRSPSLPSTFLNGLLHWTSARNGDPSGAPNHSTLAHVTNDGDFGTCGQWSPTTIGGGIHTLGLLPTVGRMYRVTVRFKVVSISNSTTVGLSAVAALNNAAFANTTSGFATAVQYGVGIHTYSTVIAKTAGAGIGYAYSVLDSTPWVRFGFRLNEAKPCVIRIQSFEVIDVTSEIASLHSANASATSAATAFSKADEAGASAGAASTARLDAETARGQSIAARDAAVVARDSAQGAATSAVEALNLTSKLVGQGEGVLKNQYLGTENGFTNWSTGPVWSDNTVFQTGREATWNLGSNVHGGITVNSTQAGWVGGKEAKGYYVEVEFTLLSGTGVSSGILMDWFSSAGTYRAQKTFVDMAASPLVANRMTTARGVFIRPAAYTGTFSLNRLYVMASFNGFLAATPAVNIKIHRVTVRVATEEEMGGGAVMATLSQTFRTTAQVNAAVANAVTALKAEVPGGLTAVVNDHRTAIANLEGYAAATAQLTAELSDGKIAGIRATVHNGAGGANHGSFLELIGDNVVAEGTLSTNRLNVGLGLNQVQDPEFLGGSLYWSFSAGTLGSAATMAVRAPGSSWSGATYPVLEVRQIGTTNAVSSVFNVGRLQNKTATTKVMPVTPGDYLEASVYASTHRCNASMGVQFLTSSEVVVSTVTVANIGNNIFGSSVDPGAWPRYGGKVLVPATAAYARIFFSKGGTTSGSDSFLFLHQPMLAKTRQTTTGLSPYSPSGQTYIDGGRLMTGSVLAQSMAVTDLSAISANLGSIVVGSANIGAAAVNTLNIAGQAVTVPVYAYAGGFMTGIGAVGGNPAISAVINRSPGFSTMIIFCAQIDGPAYAAAYFDLRRDGVGIENVHSATGQQGASQSVMFQFIDTNMSGGPTTYTVQSGILAGLPRVFKRSIAIHQFKR